jgi:CRP-like cAMP-binding protein
MDRGRGREKLDAFFAAGKELQYERRAVIIGFGEKKEEAYWITKGRVMVVSCSKEGVERIQHIYQEKELFPVKWIFDKEQYDVAFLAFADATVMVRPIADLMAFITQEPETMLAIIQQQAAVFDGLIGLNYETAEQRVAFRLITLSRRFGMAKHSYALASCPVTIQELASSIRVSSATTSKILNKFEQDGAVALKRQHILVDPEKLRQVLD